MDIFTHVWIATVGVVLFGMGLHKLYASFQIDPEDRASFWMSVFMMIGGVSIILMTVAGVLIDIARG